MKMLSKGAATALIVFALGWSLPAGAVTLQWLGYREITLYAAPTPTGPWSLVGKNLLSPYTFTATIGQMYFKGVCTAEFVTLDLPPSAPTNALYTFVYRCSPFTGMTNIFFAVGTPQALKYSRNGARNESLRHLRRQCGQVIVVSSGKRFGWRWRRPGCYPHHPLNDAAVPFDK